VSGLWSEEAGAVERPLIVLIHGSMDRSAGMLKLSRRLDADFRVLRYDRRGYGRSFPHPGPFTMVAQVVDLIGLLAGRRAVLVGHSYGGNVALTAAADHPELVAGVAVYETPLSWEPWWPGTTAGAIAVAESGNPQAAAERFMRRIIGDQRWDALPERSREMRRAEGLAMVEELADLRRNQPWIASQIAVPVIAAFGSRGAAHHRDGMRYVASLLGCAVVELADCRHDAPLSHPDLFRTAIVDPLLHAIGPPWFDGEAAATATTQARL
jgi:pimeloyl-ACP methyl ester carboxylesterase